MYEVGFQSDRVRVVRPARTPARDQPSGVCDQTGAVASGPGSDGVIDLSNACRESPTSRKLWSG